MDLQSPRKTRDWFWVTFAVVLVVLCGNELGFRVRGGEEQYLAFAKQFMNPDWIPGSFSLTEFAGTRIVFQLIVGSLLKVISIENAVFILRLLACTGMAFALARLFRTTRIGWFWGGVVTQLFVMSDQSFFGGEWVIQSFEPKVVAYIFVILALDAFARGRLTRTALLLAAATYFHVLVGGWIGVAIGINLLITRENGWFRRFVLPYVGIVFPFVIYLFFVYFRSPPLETEFDLDWVYAYYRLPHHAGIFVTTAFFIEKQLPGVIASILVLIAAILLRNRVRPKMQVFRQLLVIALSVTLFFVPIAWADAQMFEFALAGILKYYPFRLSGIAMLLGILLAGDLLRSGLEALRYERFGTYAVGTIALLLFVVQTINHIEDETEPLYSEPYVQAIRYIRENTGTRAVFAILNTSLDNVEYNAFIRLSERENFSVKKFVPGETHKLNEWYQRQLDLILVNEDNRRAGKLQQKYGVTHILSASMLPTGDLLYENDGWYIYSIR